MRKYATIIFLQNTTDFDSFESEDGKGSDGFFDSTWEEQMSFLAQWDYGPESECDLRNDPGQGQLDFIYKKGNYVMSINPSLGYAGLDRIVEAE